MESWTIGSLLDTATGYLRDKDSDSPRLDAELLLAEVLSLDRVGLYTEFDRPLTAGEVDGYRTLVARRAAHEPVAYILGRAYFRHLCLTVTPAVLIPRPETEELVEVALASLLRRPFLKRSVGRPAGSPGDGTDGGAPPATAGGAPDSSLPATVFPGAKGWDGAVEGPSSLPFVADVGTGSGAIALSLAQEAGATVLAVDNSAEALAVAARNAAAAGLESLVRFERGDLLEKVPTSSLHLVVGNPPYVRSGDLVSLAPDIRLFEPEAALDGGPDGLAVFRRLMPEASRVLRPGGSLIVEVGDGQAQMVAEMARAAGFCLTTVHEDLTRRARIVEATLPGAEVMGLEDMDEEGIYHLREALSVGAIIGLPTDTVYGIAARWDSPLGVRTLFAAKGRPPDRPVQVLFPSVEAIEEALPDLDETSARVLRHMLPGPFTFIVATDISRPPDIGTAESLGVRVPGHLPTLALLRILNVPLAATSANLSGAESVSTLTEVDPVVLAHCTVAFAQGTLEARGSDETSAASTVVDLRPLSAGGPAVVIREGVVKERTVRARIAQLL